MQVAIGVSVGRILTHTRCSMLNIEYIYNYTNTNTIFNILAGVHATFFKIWTCPRHEPSLRERTDTLRVGAQMDWPHFPIPKVIRSHPPELYNPRALILILSLTRLLDEERGTEATLPRHLRSVERAERAFKPSPSAPRPACPSPSARASAAPLSRRARPPRPLRRRPRAQSAAAAGARP